MDNSIAGESSEECSSGSAIASCCTKRSDVWQDCVEVYEPSTGIYAGAVMCKICNKQLKHDRNTSGTTHLRNHLRKCKLKLSQEKKFRSFFQRTRELPASTKDKLCDAVVSFVAEDLRPLSAVEGKGFLKLVNTCIEIGCQFGKVDAVGSLPSRHTVKRRLNDRAVEVKNELTLEVKKAISSNGIVGVTKDMWKDQKSRNFVSVTVHFISNHRLRSRVASVKQFCEEKKTGINIRQVLECTLAELGFDLESLYTHFFYVSDQGSNVQLALSNYQKIPCSCHMIATVLRHLLQVERLSCSVSPVNEEDEDMIFVSSIRDTISNVKDLITYMRRAELTGKLSSNLEQSNATRWNSNLTMLKSFQKVKDEVACILKLRDQEKRLEGIDLFVVSTLIAFLEPFQEATKYLEGDLYPTLHKVYMWKEKLLRRMSPSPTDCGLLQFLKKRGAVCINAKFEVSLIHLIAFFLNPKFKSLVALTHRKDEIHAQTRALLDKFFPLPLGNPPNDHAYVPISNKSNQDSLDDEFLEWQDSKEVEEGIDEVQRYSTATFDMNCMVNPDAQFAVLDFWTNETIQRSYPRLSHLALGVLSIPASSASSERAFSYCGNTLSKKRQRLSASSIDALSTLNSALKSVPQ